MNYVKEMGKLMMYPKKTWILTLACGNCEIIANTIFHNRIDDISLVFRKQTQEPEYA